MKELGVLDRMLLCMPPQSLPTESDYRYRQHHLESALEILPTVTSQDVVQQFLKSKDTPHSGSTWKELIEHRIQTALDDEKISADEMVRFILESEGYGKTHTFLYQYNKGRKEKTIEEIISTDSISAFAIRNDLEEALQATTILKMPKEATVSSVRLKTSALGKHLEMKIVERREQRKLSFDDYLEGNRLFRKEWTIEYIRSVNTIRLFESGLLELRIRAPEKTRKYSDEIDRVWKSPLADLVGRHQFPMKHLTRAKKYIVDHCEHLSDKILVRDCLVRDEEGVAMQVSVENPKRGLNRENQAVESLEQYLKAGAKADSQRIRWLPQQDGLPTTEIKMELKDDTNKFAIGKHCSKDDYDCVFAKLISFA